jgi:FAD/FMN-containing dehydrogenase/Fe-S oxidoreductase
MNSAPTMPLIETDTRVSLQRALEEAIKGEVRFDVASRAVYSTDASVYQVIPAGVVIPRSAADVTRAVRICREQGVSITARGGGTSQCGQSVGSGVVLDFSKYMRRILEIDPERATVRVEPGIVLDELNSRLLPHALQLPLDLSTASRATLGGMIANNSSGTRSIVYGSTVDYVLELEVLLADGSVVTMRGLDAAELERKCRQEDLEGRCYRSVRHLAQEHAGEIERRYPGILRRVGGYNLDEFVPSRGGPFDLCKLVVGSEGTLGLVLEAKLRLVGLPRAKVLCVAQFRELRDAMTATPVILGHHPSAVELMDRNLLDMTRGKTEFEPLRDFIVGSPGAILIVEFMGESMEGLPERIDRLQADLEERRLATRVHRAIEAPAQARIWKLRQAGLGLSMAEIGDTKAISFVEDTAVAPDRLAEYVDRFQDILDEHDTRAIFYAHASVGLLHIRPAVNLKTADGVSRFEGIAEKISDLVLEFGGAFSAEHGDGLARSPYQRKMFGPVLYDAFCQIKETFDENGLFNPGKIVHPRPMTESLRFGTGYHTNELQTVYDFADFGGISRAAEQCGGVGACRKTLIGTMCPSFMATREESDTTRGRASALRLAISGQLGPLGLANPVLYPVMDLCLECKACKSECPTGVDMARLKSEFLHGFYREYGAPLRARVLASGERVATWGSRFAPASNWMLRNGVARWLNERVLGIHRSRTLPEFSRRTFTAWWGRQAGQGSADAGEGEGRGPARVAVFPDTFTNFYEPGQGIATVRLAEKLGVQVVVPTRVCCGRPLISKGFLNRARRQAEAVVRALSTLAEAGVPILFCEPGCYSAVRDDHPLLLRGEWKEKAERVSAACLTFEEWAESALASSSRPVADWSGGPKKILLHGHCHQKALVGLAPAMALLSRIRGCTVSDVDGGCCGMAGSFGYEREHYDVSRAVGERRLFPAIRGRDPDTVVVAPGFSCRQQIRHFTGVEAVSVMELIEPLVGG